jgi:hypothetical protein
MERTRTALAFLIASIIGWIIAKTVHLREVSPEKLVESAGQGMACYPGSGI